MFFRNDNPHRAFPANRPDLAFAPGETRKLDGDDADAVNGLSGIVALQGDDGQAALDEYEAKRHGSSPDDVGGVGTAMAEAVTVAKQISDIATTGPLNRVVGDDQAPHGPGTGTITTKQAVQETDPVHFGPGEATVVGRVPDQVAAVGRDESPTAADVHNDQAEAGERAGRAAASLLGLDGHDNSALDIVAAEDDGDDGEPQGDEYDALEGDALDEAVKSADIKGRSSMTADEKRQALRDHAAQA